MQLDYLKRFFKPYLEYSLHTKLSREELIDGFRRKCSEKQVYLTWRGIKADFPEEDFNVFRLGRLRPDIVLRPIGRGRNSARGELHCSIEPDDSKGGSTIHVVVKPVDMRCFFYCIDAFLLLSAMSTLLAGHAVFSLFPLAFFVMSVLILMLCRTLAEAEVPRIQVAFERFVRHIELTANETDTKEPPAGKLEWATYIANMVVAVPIGGIISLGISLFVCEIILYRGQDLSEWVFFSLAGVLTLLLLAFWGRYQYKLIIMKNLPSPREHRKSLFYLLLTVIIAVAVFYWLLVCLGNAKRIDPPPKPPQAVQT